jgi:hypothetical protein
MTQSGVYTANIFAEDSPLVEMRTEIRLYQNLGNGDTRDLKSFMDTTGKFITIMKLPRKLSKL